MWIECLWAKQEQENKLIASEYFANDRFFVFLLWVCYMKTAVVRNPTEGKWIECFRDIKRTIEFATNFRMPFFGDHLAHFRRYYEGNTPVENVFRFLVSVRQV